MSTPLEDLVTRVAEIRADLGFVTLASQLRPRVGEILLWTGPKETLQLAQRFMEAKGAHPEGVYGPLLIRLMAAFERYLRMLIIESVEYRASAVKSFDDLSPKLVNRNLILTGRILANIENLRDHLTFNIEGLIVNLATCKSGNSSFSLNPQAFSATVNGVNPTAVDKALENIEVLDCWDAVGSDPKLTELLGTKGTRATGARAGERLKELSRWRNHLAHGGDEIIVSETQLRDAIEFVVSFSTALDGTVKRHLRSIVNKSR